MDCLMELFISLGYGESPSLQFSIIPYSSGLGWYSTSCHHLLIIIVIILFISTLIVSNVGYLLRPICFNLSIPN